MSVEAYKINSGPNSDNFTHTSENKGTLRDGPISEILPSSDKTNNDVIAIAFLILALAVLILVLGCIFWGVGARVGLAILTLVGKGFFGSSLTLMVGSIFRMHYR